MLPNTGKRDRGTIEKQAIDTKKTFCCFFCKSYNTLENCRQTMRTISLRISQEKKTKDERQTTGTDRFIEKEERERKSKITDRWEEIKQAENSVGVSGSVGLDKLGWKNSNEMLKEKQQQQQKKKKKKISNLACKMVRWEPREKWRQQHSVSQSNIDQWIVVFHSLSHWLNTTTTKEKHGPLVGMFLLMLVFYGCCWVISECGCFVLIELRRRIENQ